LSYASSRGESRLVKKGARLLGGILLGRTKHLCLVLAAGLVGLGPAVAHAGDLEDEVLAALNFARTHPADYSRELQSGHAGDPVLADNSFGGEDPGAVREAVDFLRHQAPLPPLSLDPRLDASAAAHTTAQGPTGQIGHIDPDGTRFPDRLHRYGWWIMAAEDISYGYATPRDVVRQLIVDSGVPDRGHRRSIFDPTFQYAGVSCGNHARYQYVCVIDFAGDRRLERAAR
jgi:uncharacterized protein YkwD